MDNNPLPDLHKVKAAKMFGVPQEEVTTEQRKIAKQTNFFEMYTDPNAFKTLFESVK